MEEKEQLNDQRHLYLKGSEELEPNSLIIPEVGFRTELGGSQEMELINLELEEQLNHSPYYRDNFKDFPNVNFIGGDGSNPIVISGRIEEEKKRKEKRIIVESDRLD